jgi:hypothetical protein
LGVGILGTAMADGVAATRACRSIALASAVHAGPLVADAPGPLRLLVQAATEVVAIALVALALAAVCARPRTL